MVPGLSTARQRSHAYRRAHIHTLPPRATPAAHASRAGGRAWTFSQSKGEAFGASAACGVRIKELRAALQPTHGHNPHMYTTRSGRPLPDPSNPPTRPPTHPRRQPARPPTHPPTHPPITKNPSTPLSLLMSRFRPALGPPSARPRPALAPHLAPALGRVSPARLRAPRAAGGLDGGEGEGGAGVAAAHEGGRGVQRLAHLHGAGGVSWGERTEMGRCGVMG